MARPSKRTSLATLTRARILELVENFEMDVRRSGSKADLVDEVARSKRASFKRALETLKRKELKEICRAHGLDDSGRAKEVIIDRILGREEEEPQPLPLFAEDDATEEPEESPTSDVPSVETVLPLLNKRRLVSVGEDVDLELSETDPKDALVEALIDVEGLDLRAVLELQGRDDLRRISCHHGLSDQERRRSVLIDQLMALAEGGGEPRDEPAIDASFPRSPEPDRPRRYAPGLSAAEPPAPGEPVQVRHRQYLVEDVVPPPEHEVLDRLFALNAERAADERAVGVNRRLQE